MKLTLEKGSAAPRGHFYATTGRSWSKSSRLLHLVPTRCDASLCGIDPKRGFLHGVHSVRSSDRVCETCTANLAKEVRP